MRSGDDSLRQRPLATPTHTRATRRPTQPGTWNQEPHDETGRDSDHDQRGQKYELPHNVPTSKQLAPHPMPVHRACPIVGRHAGSPQAPEGFPDPRRW